MIANIACVVKACQNLGLSYRFFDQNVLQVADNPKLIFANRHTPFNQDSHSLIAKDKGFQYQILKNAVDLPKTKGYFQDDWRIEDIVDDIQKSFPLPVIVKKNRGSCGCNVFLCSNDTKIKKAVERIFDEGSKDYDYVCLAQQKISIAKEYRVIVWQGKIMLMYQKVTQDMAKNFELISPLHTPKAYAELMEPSESSLHKEFQILVDKIYQIFPISWAGLDVVIDKAGKIFLIEINSAPSFDIFCKFCGDYEVVKVFEKVLSDKNSIK